EFHARPERTDASRLSAPHHQHSPIAIAKIPWTRGVEASARGRRERDRLHGPLCRRANRPRRHYCAARGADFAERYGGNFARADPNRRTRVVSGGHRAVLRAGVARLDALGFLLAPEQVLKRLDG